VEGCRLRLYEDYDLAFYHINKTGGTSVNKFLMSLLGVPKNINKTYLHEPLKFKIERLGKKFEELTVFTTIRNPYARFVSLYTFRNGLYRNKSGQKEKRDLSFRDWLAEEPEFAITECLSPVPDNLTIIKLENIELELKKFLTKVLGREISGEIPHIKQTKHAPYTEYYDDDLKRLVYNREKWVFDNYYGGF
jgi:hypothetical protein